MHESASPQQVYMLQATDSNQARLIPVEWRQFGAPCSSCSHTVDPRDCPFTRLNPSSLIRVASNGATAYEPIALQDIHFARDFADPSKYFVTNLIAHDAAPIALDDLRIARDPRDPRRWIVINMVASLSTAPAAAVAAPAVAAAAAAADAARWNVCTSGNNEELLNNDEAAVRLEAFHSFTHRQQLISGYAGAIAHNDEAGEETNRKEIKKEVKEEEIEE